MSQKGYMTGTILCNALLVSFVMVAPNVSKCICNVLGSLHLGTFLDYLLLLKMNP